MLRRIFKGVCGIACLMAGGGALIVAASHVEAGRETPVMLFFLFLLSGIGGVWLFVEALANRSDL